MDLLNIVHAKTSLTAIIGSIRLSLSDIREKNGHRKDLIDTLEKYDLWMEETLTTFTNLEKENAYILKKSLEYYNELLTLRKENEELKKIID